MHPQRPLPIPGPPPGQAPPMSAQPRFFPPAQPPPGFGAFVPQPAVQPPLGVVLDRPSTLYVGKIPDSLDDKTLRQVLEACGQIMSWKRPTDPMSGRPKAFGLCEFRSGAHALRAMRVIGPLVLRDGTTLLVKVDAKTQAFLDQLDAVDSANPAMAAAKAEEDGKALAAVRDALGLGAAEAAGDAAAAAGGVSGTVAADSSEVGGAAVAVLPSGPTHGPVDETERAKNEQHAAQLLSALSPSSAQPADKDKEIDRERARRRAREARDKLEDRARQREREAARLAREDEDEYVERLRRWEAHEHKYERWAEREAARAEERRRLLTDPTALEFFGPHARDELRRRRRDELRADEAHAHAERPATRRDEAAGARTGESARLAAAAAESDAAAAVAAQGYERPAGGWVRESERLAPPHARRTSGSLSPDSGTPLASARGAPPPPPPHGSPLRVGAAAAAASSSDEEGEGGEAFDDIMGLAMEAHARGMGSGVGVGGREADAGTGDGFELVSAGGAAATTTERGASSAQPLQPLRLGGIALGANARKRPAPSKPPSLFAAGTDEEVGRRRRLERIEYSADEEAAVATVPLYVKERERERQAAVEQAKRLIGRIPVDEAELFAFPIDWVALDQHNVIEAKLRPWVSKKLCEYVGEEDATDLVDFVTAQLKARGSPAEITEQLAIVLDDDAKTFCAKLWRMLAFEALAAAELPANGT